MSSSRSPVTDWTSDFDHLDPAWARDPLPIWAALRDRCPLASTERFGGAYLAVRAADLRSAAHDTQSFSSISVLIRDDEIIEPAPAPPMTSDPPFHRAARLALLPAFHPRKLAAFEPEIEATCRSLLDALPMAGSCDAAEDFARPLALRAVAGFVGLPAGDALRLRPWIGAALDAGACDANAATQALAELAAYVGRQIARRRYAPGSGVLGHLLSHRIDGAPLSDDYIVASVRLLLLAGVETTAAALGSALWHLATEPEDRAHIIAHPADMSSAVEELLRLHAPVSMARMVVAPAQVGGVQLEAGRRLLLCYPAGNRDPLAFPQPDSFRPERRSNRHMAFGVGIHRCIGKDLARSVLRVALSAWLARHPAFGLAGEPTWTPGAVRGPRHLPLRLARP